MQSFRKPVRRTVRPAASRIRRVRSGAIARVRARSPERLPDLSELVLYGQA